jgi:D-alanyl-D-alanine carboxypeptidase
MSPILPTRTSARAFGLHVLLPLAAAFATATSGPAGAQDTTGDVAGPKNPVLQSVLDSARTALDAPGAVAAVLLPDGTAWAGATGFAAPDAPTTPDTPFELGSITKTYTAAVALSLVSDGTLALDDRLSGWYPEIPGADRITVRQLLNHTHGLHDPMQEPDFVPAVLQNPARTWTLDDHLARMGDSTFAPGEGWAYSNIGFHLLGAILERESGVPLADLFRSRLLDPLALEDTWFAASGPDPRTAAAAFIDVTGDGDPDPISLMMPWTAFRSSAGAAGAMVATASDTARWLHLLHAGAVLSTAEWNQMTAWVDRPDGNLYGLGLLRLEREQGPLVGHKGNSAGYSAGAFHDPASGITVAVLTNAHAVDVTEMVVALLQAAAEGLSPPSPDDDR